MERVKLVPDLSADLAARKVIVAAFCYYVLDSPIMSDEKYDELSDYVADHWDDLMPDRRWALRDPRSTQAGGSHIWFSLMAVACALNHHKYKTGELLILDGSHIKTSKQGRKYVTCNCRCYKQR